MSERTQHRRRWRGKRMSMRRRIPTDPIGRIVDEVVAGLIRGWWRAGTW